MLAGFHLVCDLHCNTCNNLLGWKVRQRSYECVRDHCFTVCVHITTSTTDPVSHNAAV